MLDINITKKRPLNFEIQLNGIDHNQLSGYLRVIVDGVEYGFPAIISAESVDVEIPALKYIVKKELHEDDQLEAKLEVYGGGYYLNPWSDKLVVKTPVMMEAKVKEGLSSQKPKVKITAKPILKEKIEEKKKSEQITKKVTPVVEKKEVKKQTKPNTAHDGTVITEQMIKDYISTKTKNERIQEIIYTKAVEAAKSTDTVKILREVVKYMKNKLRSNTMSEKATIVNSTVCAGTPVFIVEYLYPTDSTGLIELELLSLIKSAPYPQVPETRLTGKAYAIDLLTFGISHANATSFDVSLLNVDDVSKLDTINEVLKYSGANKRLYNTYTSNVIMNRDTVLTNKLYLYFKRNAGSSGAIRIILSYMVLQGG